MANGLSLHIGLNSVDPAHYGGWSGPLTACEADAVDMAGIGASKGFESSSLLTKVATRDAVTTAIKGVAKTLKAGDLFFLTYSGHGGQLPDQNQDEIDGMDETWCLYDGQLVDDELFQLLAGFAAGVRILVLSDSCHSGTVLKDIAEHRFSTDGRVTRAMPRDVAMRTYRQNKASYDAILADPTLAKAEQEVMASAILISGCQDNQLSMDGTFNGLFTSTLLQVWNNGSFAEGHAEFHQTILKRMPPEQTPNLFRLGNLNAAFLAQRPFEIG